MEPDAKPTIEALEAERRRLKELERNLAAERDRIQETASREIARMQAALRDAAERAGKRERELESTQRKLERRSDGRRLGVFGAASGRGGADAVRVSTTGCFELAALLGTAALFAGGFAGAGGG